MRAGVAVVAVVELIRRDSHDELTTAGDLDDDRIACSDGDQEEEGRERSDSLRTAEWF